MYTEEQYKKAKAKLADPETETKYDAERVGNWAQKVAEYEEAHQAGAQSTPEPAAPPADHGFEHKPSLSDYDRVKPDVTRDESRPNASKQIRFTDKTEHVSKSHNPLAVIAKNMANDQLTGPSSTMYFEPTNERFEAEMGPYLAAKGIAPGSKEYGIAYAEYKDRKWEQAYQNAVATDTPLTRVEHTKQSGNWDKLGNFLGQAADVGAAFTEGYGRGFAGPSREIALSLKDKLTGRDEVSGMRERAERNPAASTVGEFMGSISPYGAFNKLTGAVGRLAKPATRLGRYALSGLAGGVGASTQLLANAGGQALANTLHGRPVDEDAKGQFANRLLFGSALGVGAGVFGEGAAGLANRYSKGIRAETSDIGPELTNAEASGSATHLWHGVKPSSDVERMLEKGRGPVPGEGKLPPTGRAVEYAMRDVREPIVAQQVDEHAAAVENAQRESLEAYGKDRGLRTPKTMKELVKALRYSLTSRSQPEAASKFIPGAGDALPARDNGPLLDFSRRIIKPRLVYSVDAAGEAARGGGDLVSLEEARRMGFNVRTPGAWSSNGRAPSSFVTPERGSSLHTDVSDSELLPTPERGSGTYADVSDSEILPGRESQATTPMGDEGVTLLPPPLAQPGEPSPTHARILDTGRPPANSYAEHHPSLRHIVDTQPPPANSFTVPDIIVPEGKPASEFLVMLEPRSYDALKMDEVINSIDDAAKVATKVRPDPVWKDLMRAARVDRDQFGKAWSGLKDLHYQKFNELEQRAAHAGITENEYFPELTGNAQKSVNSALRNYGVDAQDTNEALANLADKAGVRQGLETLKGTRAYVALKEKAKPQASATTSGGFMRVGGLVPAAKLRADAIARGVARGPEGNPLFIEGLNPEAATRLANEPLGRTLLPSSGLLAMGRGAAALKTGSVYDSAVNRGKPAGTLTPEEQAQIERYLSP